MDGESHRVAVVHDKGFQDVSGAAIAKVDQLDWMWSPQRENQGFGGGEYHARIRAHGVIWAILLIRSIPGSGGPRSPDEGPSGDPPGFRGPRPG